MKKLVSLALALVLVMGLCSAASAAPYKVEAPGVTFDIPDGMTPSDMSEDDYIVTGIAVDGDTTLAYSFTAVKMDGMEGKTMNDLSDEEYEEIGVGIGAAIENPSLADAEVNGIPVLVVGSGDETQLQYMFLANGYMCYLAAAKNDGVPLNDDQIATTAALMGSVQIGAAK